jgi:hypothetical protein
MKLLALANICYELNSYFIRPALLLASILLAACQPTNLAQARAELAKEKASAHARFEAISKIRLDTPATTDNSVLFTFEDGPTMRVPKILFSPEFLTEVGSRTIQARALAFEFWYPDMTLSDQSRISVEVNRGHPPEHLDTRPWVRILYMYYVPPDSDSFVPGSEQPPFKFNPRPPRMALNLWCLKLVDGHCDIEMVRIPSRVNLGGIDPLISKNWLNNHPEKAIKNPEEGGVFVAKPESPYELWMNCGLNCDANVYSKKHHLQYRMVFPGQAVVQTDVLIKKIDRLLDAWSVLPDIKK